jgi:hypothetical protein
MSLAIYAWRKNKDSVQDLKRPIGNPGRAYGKVALTEI